MPSHLSSNRIAQNEEFDQTPLLRPVPMSPGFESAMRLSPAWLAAAQMLLADVRDEIIDLVALADDDSVLVSRQRLQSVKTEKTGRVSARGKLELEPPVSDSEIDIAVSDDTDFESSTVEISDGVADEATDEEVFEASSKVGSSLEFYLKRLRTLKAPSLEDEKALVCAAQSGDADAVNLLVSKSLRVVPAIARTFVGRGLPLEDLIEEGNLGLYRAIPRFDLNLGYRFATYARWWVKHEIRTAVLNQGRLIRLPIHIFKALSRVRRQLESAGEIMPGALRSSADAFQNRCMDDSLRFTLDEAQVLLKLTELPLSLDVPSASDPESSLADTLPSELDVIPESCMQKKQRSQLLMTALEQLASSEREVVMRRYGFHSGEPETLHAIGKSLKLTAERVRQIQKQALINIQRHFETRGLSLNELL